ncbi:MAG: hypothetical protein KAJ51_12820, partial [Thermoplasmata archaeon]|nr:hypothetical protein [Thermoplasmata archaeon]
MGLNLIDSIANDLAKIKKDSDYSQANPKYYTSSGIILEPYAKLNKLSVESLRNLVKTNSFFKLSSGTIQTGLFSKRDKKVEVIELEDTQLIRKEFIQNPDKILKESSASSLLTQIMLQIILEERSKVALKPTQEAHAREFDTPKEDRVQLYEKYFPDELDKYQREGRSESNLEKKFHKKVATGSEFHFSDGKVAYNLLTWFQCLQMASTDIIAKHIRNNDFSNWLEDKVKAPELARICVKIAKRNQSEEITEKEVKNELLSGITKTSLNNIIFDTIILPLIRKVKSTDQSKAEEAIDKLLMLNDSRVVEPLLDRIFDSQPQIRNKII